MLRRVLTSVVAVASIVLLIMLVARLIPARPPSIQQARAASTAAESPTGTSTMETPVPATLEPYPNLQPSVPPTPPYPSPRAFVPPPGVTVVYAGPPAPATPTSPPLATATALPSPTALPTPAVVATAARGQFRAGSIHLVARVSLLPLTAYGPQWSPDGKLLLYQIPTGDWLDAPGRQPGSAMKFELVEFRVRSLSDNRDWQLAPKGYQAVWSPRDLKVAYTVPSPSGQAQYYVVNADGSGRRLLGTGPALSEIHFAGPDDVAIAQSGSVEIVDIATGAIAGKIASYDPAGMVGLTGDAWAFSPDGSLLAANYAGNARGLLVIGQDGSVRARIEPDLGVGAFAWRLGSGALAYVPDGAASVLLKVWDRASNQSRTLVNAGLRVLTLSWSPDGGVIAFSARPGGTNVTPDSFRLGFVNSDGTEVGYPRWAPGSFWVARWSPDGRHLATVVNSAVYVYEVTQ